MSGKRFKCTWKQNVITSACFVQSFPFLKRLYYACIGLMTLSGCDRNALMTNVKWDWLLIKILDAVIPSVLSFWSCPKNHVKHSLEAYNLLGVINFVANGGIISWTINLFVSLFFAQTMPLLRAESNYHARINREAVLCLVKTDLFQNDRTNSSQLDTERAQRNQQIACWKTPGTPLEKPQFYRAV